LDPRFLLRSSWLRSGRASAGSIEDAIASFAEEFSFKDHGVDLEFKNKELFAKFFRKARELYPDSLLQTDAIYVSGDRVITEWTLQANVTEPWYYAGASPTVSVHGVSIVLIDNGKVADWSDGGNESSPGQKRHSLLTSC
jgi:SnoaL-like domain